MNFRLFALLATVSLATFASPAVALWDALQWGLSPEQLADTSGKPVRPCRFDIDVCTMRLLGYHPTHFALGLTVAGLQADASYVFEAGKLTRTVLKFGGDGRNAPYLERALAKRYGAPIDVKRSFVPHVTFNDPAKGSTVSVIDLSPSYVVIDYQPAGGTR